MMIESGTSPRSLASRRISCARWMSVGFAVIAAAVIAYLPYSSAVTAAAQGAAGGDAAHGKELFEKRCTGCHSLDNEKEGPRLRGVYGRKTGSVPTFAYSDALKKASITWDAVSLDKWLTDPDKFIPDNDMAFRLASPADRLDVIAYLKQLSSK